MRTCYPLMATILLAGLGGCGSDGNDAEQTGRLNFGVSDAPVQEASEVVLVFNHVVLIPESGGDPIVIDFAAENGAPERVDLLKNPGTTVHPLVTDLELPVGDYRMCLYALDGEVGNADLSYVTTPDGTVPLQVNAKGSCFGTKPDTSAAGRLKLAEGDRLLTINTGINNFVAEFDLHKGLVDPVGQAGMFIKPNSVTLLNTAAAGSISGALPEAQASACINDLSATDPIVHAAYLYVGSLDRTGMGDVIGSASYPSGSPLVEPAAVATVGEDDQYQFGFVGEGSYSIGYSCLAGLDQPESHETDFAIYQHYVDVTVVAEQETVQDLLVIAP
ncbi:DUF4382 domain-containing protein [Ferrimonas pelagia]|uniref:DUF4382 domain-containing protein n=1 Tax=Ferrimonas pelagia TaxID=1177826 RepID=A0ABP9FFU8_9GAMM